MKYLKILSLLLAASAAFAADYPLQAQVNGTLLFVSGYSVNAATGVVGEIYYKHQGVCSGRGCRPPKPVFYQGTARWDLYGRLLSVNYALAPVRPAPISVVGTKVTYGTDPQGDATGQTSPTVGFVHHLTSDYVWSAAPALATTNQNPISFQATLTSVGDVDLIVYSVQPGSRFGANVVVVADGCTGRTLPVGAKCTIAGTYDATAFVESESPIIYDSLVIDLTTNTAITHQYSQTVAVTVN